MNTNLITLSFILVLTLPSYSQKISDDKINIAGKDVFLGDNKKNFIEDLYWMNYSWNEDTTILSIYKGDDPIFASLIFDNGKLVYVTKNLGSYGNNELIEAFLKLQDIFDYYKVDNIGVFWKKELEPGFGYKEITFQLSANRDIEIDIHKNNIQILELLHGSKKLKSKR